MYLTGFLKIRLKCVDQFRGEILIDKVAVSSSTSGHDIIRNRLDFSNDRSKGKIAPNYGKDIENPSVSIEKMIAIALGYLKFFMENLLRS